ncbi:kinase-like domain-containing protein [Mycena olivaceomarginata]|nr:kinase-like domain-containing protein [Mycena olivaceomarginata]
MVYTEGYHEDNHQSVAIKTVLRQKLSAKLFENLQSEIQILKSLSHRHITKLIDIRTDRNICLIMEYCSGGDLTNYIKKRGCVKMLELERLKRAYPDPY